MSDKKNKIENVDNSSKVAEIWLEANWKKCLALLVLVIVVGMVIFSVIYVKKQNAREAKENFAAAEVANLAALLEKNPDAPGAAAARIRLADELLSKKDYAGAKAQFSAVATAENIPEELRSRAKLSIPACDELSGNQKAAADGYQALMNDLSTPLRVRDEAGFHAGRLLLAQNDARGKEILQRLADSPADGSLANPWKAHAAALLKGAK